MSRTCVTEDAREQYRRGHRTHRRAACFVVAGLLAALVAPVTAAASDSANRVEQILSTVVLPERASDSYPDANTVSCRRSSGKARCTFKAGTIDGDVFWKGRAAFSGLNSAADKFRYRLHGTKTLCAAPATDPGCKQRFAWVGRGCGYVTNGIDGEGGGAATGIHAVKLKCRRARAAARRCLLGDRGAYRFARTLGGRYLLRRSPRLVSFAPVGGGRCAQL